MSDNELRSACEVLLRVGRAGIGAKNALIYNKDAQVAWEALTDIILTDDELTQAIIVALEIVGTDDRAVVLAAIGKFLKKRALPLFLSLTDREVEEEVASEVESG